MENPPRLPGVAGWEATLGKRGEKKERSLRRSSRGIAALCLRCAGRPEPQLLPAMRPGKGTGSSRLCRRVNWCCQVFGEPCERCEPTMPGARLQPDPSARDNLFWLRQYFCSKP